MDNETIDFEQVVAKGCGLDVHKETVVATVSGTVIGSSPSTMAASQVTTDTTNFSNILTTSETTVQAALDKLDDFQNTYVTVANAEAATGVDNKLCYVVETETWYRYEATGSAYTDDNKYVLSTGEKGVQYESSLFRRV